MITTSNEKAPDDANAQVRDDGAAAPGDASAEHGGPKGPEPTRYGDWEKNGRCIDF